MRPDRTLFSNPLGPWLILAILYGCGASSTSSSFALPGADVSGSDGSSSDVALGDSPSTDSKLSAPPDASTADAEPINTAPTFGDITTLSLDQGASTNLDLAPLLHDAEDATASLTLSWSAKHVALKDPGNHKIYLVAPTTWTGTEVIVLTVTDSGGGTASSSLTVVVKSVTVAPITPQDCGKHTFSYSVGSGTHAVLLSGSFNGWAKTADKADAMNDPGSTGTYSVTKTLAAGTYQYKFVVDGAWKTDSANPNQVPDGYGGTNAVIEVKPCAP